MTEATFPTADEIAKAIVAACKCTGENPLMAFAPETLRARHYALDALTAVFPEARKIGLSKCLGYKTPKAGTTHVYISKRTPWWREEFTDEVVGVLVAEQYGEQAQ
ncbi:hypothetical protein LJR231_001592 [Phyllobacterium sp. LjRoot231]|uniref:hypothetical protein n=1 Tax=Phyllobacterium sp. LjRoot231 TaxID=3342289 RepID=UPI003ECC7549